MDGEPIQIVKISEEGEHSFFLDEEALNSVLCQDEIKDKPVCIVTVAGAFRKGKSFLLNIMLRYLESGGSEGWLEDDGVPLKGFHWRGGSQRDTTGILMWSKVYTITQPSGQEVAVVLVDTQGSFDKNSTVRDCATVFALSLMTSSVLVYNLFNNIQEDDLQHLHYFTEYGRLALDSDSDAPFQKLFFLVRDWQYPYEREYGADGGKALLDYNLEIEENQHPELKNLRKNISNCFSEMSCFLLPHPGRDVATKPSFTGQLANIDPEFLDFVRLLMPTLLSSESIKVKKSGGKNVKCKEIVQFFKSYMDVLKGNDMPEPKSMLEVTIEANNLVSLASAKELYIASMESLCGGDKPYLSEQVLEIEHLRIIESAMEEFDSRRKMGGEEFSHKYREQLRGQIDESYEHYKAHNLSKNIFKAANTPITIFVMWGFLYVLSQIAALFMLYPVANLANLLMWGLFLVGVTWGYARYSGDFADVGVTIEEMTQKIWDNVVQPILNQVVERGGEIAVRQAVNRLNSQTAPTPMSKKRL